MGASWHSGGWSLLGPERVVGLRVGVTMSEAMTEVERFFKGG